jgi:hypothetical protein
MIPIRNIGDGFGYGGAARNAPDSPNTLCMYSLQSIVYEIAQRAGMDPRTIDVTRLGGIDVRGFAITNVYAAANALLALSQIFLFDPSNVDGKVAFIPRGADTVGIINEDDMVISDDAVEHDTRQDSISVPRVLHLNYFDIDGGLNTDTQPSERAGDRRATGEKTIETVVVMNADEARRAVTVNHKVMVEEQRGTVDFVLTDSDLRYALADNVFVERDGTYKRMRIVKAGIDEGTQPLTCVYDRQSAYVSNIEGHPVLEPTAPPSRIVGPTLVEPLDIHLLRDADDRLGAYIALAGTIAGWRGATVEMSLDGGANYIMSTDWSSESVIGKLTDPVGAAAVDYPDDISRIEIDIAKPETELDATDLAGMLNRANVAMIGDEIIQFSGVDETSEGHFVLSGLLRGRLQTDAVSHSVGERFVLLDRQALYFVPADLSYLMRDITLRATSFGMTADEGTVVTFSFTGQSQTEYKPAYLSARRAGTDIHASWQGVGKLGSGARVAQGAYFTGYHVTATDGSATISLDTNQQEATVDASGLSGPVTLSVSQHNQLTGYGPAAEVTV